MKPPTIPTWLTRDFIRAHPEIIFVFGDNLRETGNAGQAGVCRGMTNCYGVPSKKLPCMKDEAFYRDVEFELINKPSIDTAIAKIPLDGRFIYVIPNIGKGFAQCDWRAPLTFKYLTEQLTKLEMNNI